MDGEDKNVDDPNLAKSLVVPRPVKLRNCRARVVVISDTHYKHCSLFKKRIPRGDILIHCGDFSKRLSLEKVEKDLKDLNEFFKIQPHPHKLLIAGNHEMGAFKRMSQSEIQDLLPDVRYLADELVEIDGVKIYGHYWASQKKWSSLPAGIDILVTHMPPYNILDLAWENNDRSDQSACPVCGEVHPGFAHWGDDGLLQQILKMKPPVHAFGHVHDAHGIVDQGDTLFLNSAMDLAGKPIVFDIEPDPDYNPPPLADAAAANEEEPKNSARAAGCKTS
eukprot:TRINITY_DN22670_c0_g1_i1.p1 TRINITY_DN22670_c0_g1~~TRINITY_DN22670_c0_g1_i1.p1  ORF type:complete len:278 (-),score=75.43 TRINITY_DN22670_c0_g1_i1:1196-2029(-)